jgi:hypothetical protein
MSHLSISRLPDMPFFHQLPLDIRQELIKYVYECPFRVRIREESANIHLEISERMKQWSIVITFNIPLIRRYQVNPLEADIGQPYKSLGQFVYDIIGKQTSYYTLHYIRSGNREYHSLLLYDPLDDNEDTITYIEDGPVRIKLPVCKQLLDTLFYISAKYTI